MGCYDDIVAGYSGPEEELCRVRHCNWPRFLTFRQTNNGGNSYGYPSGEKLSSSTKMANLRCTKNQDGQVVYETMDIIAPNTDLVVALLDNLDEEEQIFHAMSYTIQAIASFIRGTSIHLVKRWINVT